MNWVESVPPDNQTEDYLLASRVTGHWDQVSDQRILRERGMFPGARDPGVTPRGGR